MMIAQEQDFPMQRIQLQDHVAQLVYRRQRLPRAFFGARKRHLGIASALPVQVYGAVLGDDRYIGFGFGAVQFSDFVQMR